jgi:hypothetical protein
VNRDAERHRFETLPRIGGAAARVEGETGARYSPASKRSRQP